MFISVSGGFSIAVWCSSQAAAVVLHSACLGDFDGRQIAAHILISEILGWWGKSWADRRSKSHNKQAAIICMIVFKLLASTQAKIHETTGMACKQIIRITFIHTYNRDNSTISFLKFDICIGIL